MASPLIVPARAIGSAEHFVGRRVELEAFRHLRQMASTSAKPQLAVIQAPPGAGKSALLRESANAAEAERAVVIEIRPAMLDRADELRHGVLSQFALRDRWRDLLPELRLGFSAGAEASVSAGGRQRPAVSALLDGFESLSRRSGPTGSGPSCLLILMDEAQKLADRDPTAVELLLDALRNREGLRTVTILAGLPDTVDALRSPSLARADRDLGLGALHREESVELLELWLADNGFRVESPARLDKIAGHAQDWPEHLVHHVTAMVEAAARNGGLVDESVVVSTNAAALPAMKHYYDQRLRVLNDRPARDHHALFALATAAGRLGGGLNAATAAGIIEAAGARDDLRPALRYAGVLVDAGGRWRFAIPSLRRYVLETGDPLPAEFASRLDEIVAPHQPAARESGG